MCRAVQWWFYWNWICFWDLPAARPPGAEAVNVNESWLGEFDLTCLYLSLPLSSWRLKNLLVVTQRPELRNRSRRPCLGAEVTSNLKKVENHIFKVFNSEARIVFNKISLVLQVLGFLLTFISRKCRSHFLLHLLFVLFGFPLDRIQSLGLAIVFGC